MDCKWWETWPSAPTGLGACRGAPPIKGVQVHSSYQFTGAEFPLTFGRDRQCGAFAPAEEVIEEGSEYINGRLVTKQTVRLRDGSEVVREVSNVEDK